MNRPLGPPQCKLGIIVFAEAERLQFTIRAFHTLPIQHITASLFCFFGFESINKIVNFE